MNTAAAWGKFAAEILSGNWDGAMEELTKVKDIINDRVPSPMIIPYLSHSPIQQFNSIIEPG
jgi:hypothetical protein